MIRPGTYGTAHQTLILAKSTYLPKKNEQVRDMKMMSSTKKYLLILVRKMAKPTILKKPILLTYLEQNLRIRPQPGSSNSDQPKPTTNQTSTTQPQQQPPCLQQPSYSDSFQYYLEQHTTTSSICIPISPSMAIASHASNPSSLPSLMFFAISIYVNQQHDSNHQNSIT